MFDLRDEQRKRDRMVGQLTMNSLRLTGLMALAVLGLAGLGFAVLSLWR